MLDPTKPADRTEEEKLTQAPLKVILGGKEFDVAPLVIKYSREWRKKSMPLITFLIQYSRKSEDDMEDSIEELFGAKTDGIIESFFEYAKDLPRPEIEEIATDGEIITAFMEVFSKFVSPLSEAAKQAPLGKAPTRKATRSR